MSGLRRSVGAAALFGLSLLSLSAVPVAPDARAEPPRFIAPAGLVELQRAFAEDAFAAVSAERFAAMPAFGDSAAPGDGIGRLLSTGTFSTDPATGEEQAKLWSGEAAAPVTTSDLQATLAQARADAGEARALSDEMHRHADALSRSMAQGVIDRSTPPLAPEATAPVDLAAARATALREAVALQAAARQAAALQAEMRQAVVQQDGAPEQTLSAGEGPVAMADATSASGTAVGPARQPEPKQVLPGRMALGHVVPVDADAIAADVHTAQAGEPPPPARGRRAGAERSRQGKAAAEKQRPARRPAVVHAAPVKTVDTQHRRADVSQGAAGGSAGAPGNAKPATEASASGGLFSWLKPFQFPKEIGALGWSN